MEKHKLILLGETGYPSYVIHFSNLCPEGEYLHLKKAVEWKTCFSLAKGIDYLTLTGDGYRVFSLNWLWIEKLERFR